MVRRRADLVGAVRRRVEQGVDQVVTRTRHRLGAPGAVAPFDGDPRLALVTVNFSTTRYLKLMLCTLGEQSALWFLQHVVIVDNGSRDGGLPFLRRLADRVPRVLLVERHHFPSHAAGMRAGIAAIDAADRTNPPDERAGILVFCDPDVVFRNADALLDLAAVVVEHDAAFAGEARAAPGSAHPDIQASFFAVRRDVLARRDVEPLVNHGSPAAPMQASIVAAGLTISDFPSNHGGYVLHRGRAGVAAAGQYHPTHSYAQATTTDPHFMGVPDGPAIWAAVEAQWADLLDPAGEPALLDHLAERFAVLGRRDAPPAPGPPPATGAAP